MLACLLFDLLMPYLMGQLNVFVQGRHNTGNEKNCLHDAYYVEPKHMQEHIGKCAFIANGKIWYYRSAVFGSIHFKMSTSAKFYHPPPQT